MHLTHNKNNIIVLIIKNNIVNFKISDPDSELGEYIMSFFLCLVTFFSDKEQISIGKYCSSSSLLFVLSVFYFVFLIRYF